MDVLIIVVFIIMVIKVTKTSRQKENRFDPEIDQLEKQICANCCYENDIDDPKCKNCGAKFSLYEYSEEIFCRNCKNFYDKIYKKCPFCQTEGWISDK